jgi:hypothetical protein
LEIYPSGKVLLITVPPEDGVNVFRMCLKKKENEGEIGSKKSTLVQPTYVVKAMK